MRRLSAATRNAAPARKSRTTVLLLATCPSNLKKWGTKRSRNPIPIHIRPTKAMIKKAFVLFMRFFTYQGSYYAFAEALHTFDVTRCKHASAYIAILMAASFSTFRTSLPFLTSRRTPLPSAYVLALSITFKTDSGKSSSCAAFTALSPSANEARK